MSDLVERLRANVAAQEGGPYVSLAENRSAQAAAADRIEALEAERDRLRAIVDLVDAHCGRNNMNCPTAPKIRAALED